VFIEAKDDGSGEYVFKSVQVVED